MNLKVPYHHQKNCYFCGPTCLKMVLEDFGVKKTEKELAMIAGTTEKAGTSHYGMIGTCKKLGFSCFVHENANLKNIESFLKAKLPVISDWTDDKSNTGHYNIITEIGKKNIFFNDPWYGPKYAVDREIFEKYWNDKMTRGVKWIMVILPKCTKTKSHKNEVFGGAGNQRFPCLLACRNQRFRANAKIRQEIEMKINGNSIMVKAGRIYKT